MNFSIQAHASACPIGEHEYELYAFWYPHTYDSNENVRSAFFFSLLIPACCCCVEIRTTVFVCHLGILKSRRSIILFDSHRKYSVLCQN